ncbi:MAG: UvrD-helicase domain-containing protein [Spirochaetaceae bacterium]|jgi:ATP-dependent helicase/nuclease subunit A|nr:UvrD-helicase domain-containing protein [Spirochaetaceae bacterium]
MRAVFRPDKDQEAAYLADKNTVVSAGAGSGKTTVLAERYVRLITARGLDPEAILTLTFTRKAAAEMYSRIFSRLSASEHPRAREALARFNTARISTLDSFCGAIVRGGSYRYGIPADFSTGEAALRRTAGETAVEILMTRRKEPALRRLVATRTFEAIAGDLFADLGLSVISMVRPENFSALAKAQICFIEEKIGESCKNINALGEVILAVEDSQVKTLTQAKAAIRSRFPLKSRDAEGLYETARFFSSGESFKLPPSNARDRGLIELREPAVLLKKEAANLMALTSALVFREDIPVIGEILDEYARLLVDRKRRQGLLSFQDTMELAVDILTHDRELRGYYKSHIKAIMIDEFQDNNDLQKKLLYLLAERDDAASPGIPKPEDLAPDKLFFVGDEKQSIYRFRGADVSVFRGLSRELGSALSLRTNYRSTPRLTAFFNILFPGVFGVPDAPFEAEFREMLPPAGEPPSREKGLPGNFPPPVELYIREIPKTGGGESAGDDDEVSSAAGEALAAAERIIGGVKNGEFQFGDVAVLFRTTTHQHEYERTFRQAGIPFNAADPRGILAEGPANDLYAILRLVLFPQDRNAYGTVLRSPFVNLGDESFLKIMLEKPGEPFPETAALGNPGEQARYEQGKTIFRALRDRVDTGGIAPALDFLWYETGYRTMLLHDRESRPNLEHFDYLYTLALDADRRGLSMGAFLDELAPLMGSAEKMEAGDLPEKKNLVSLMTIHKSKGLEFPVLILANAGSHDMAQTNAKPCYVDSRFGPVINLKSEYAKRNRPGINYFYEQGRELARRQAGAELKRLFYVAVTRAQKQLIIFGGLKVPLKTGVPDIPSPDNPLFSGAYAEVSGEGKRQSFITLLSQGLLGKPEALPYYRVIPFTAPGIDEYARRIGALRRALPGNAAPVPDTANLLRRFYKKPAGMVTAAKTLITSPSLIEAYAAPLAPPEIRHGPPLSPFKCDPWLEDRRDGDDLSGESGNLKKAFGILCHRAIEKLLSGPDTGTLRDFPGLKEVFSVFRRAELSGRVLELLEAEALELARLFLASPLGKEAAAARRRRSEFPFILPAGDRPVLIQGIIDLIYEYGERCIIIDFKTDRHLIPESHKAQMACYRMAASAFSDLPVQSMLVYLRGMRIVPFEPHIEAEDFFAWARAAAEA